MKAADLLTRVKGVLATGEALSQKTLAYRCGAAYSSIYPLVHAGELVEVGRLPPDRHPFQMQPQRIGIPILALRRDAKRHGAKKLPKLCPIVHYREKQRRMREAG